MPPQFLAEQLTLSQPGGADYTHHSTCPPGFSDLATALTVVYLVVGLEVHTRRRGATVPRARLYYYLGLAHAQLS
jgi:hypothetical protein